MQVKLRKVAQASGYQITYTTDKRFKSNVKSTYTSALTKTLTALKTKKTYYVKVLSLIHIFINSIINLFGLLLEDGLMFHFCFQS